MNDVIVLRELEEIKAISHPYRVEILEAFGQEPLSAKQLSEMLGEPHAKINYHIKILASAGIIDLVDEKIKSGIVEKYYLPKAKMVIIDKSIWNSPVSGTMAKTINQASLSIFEKVSDDYYRAAETNEVGSKHIRHYNDMYLTEEDAKKMMDLLDLEISKLSKEMDVETPGEGKRPYNFATLAVPNVKKEKNAKTKK